MPTKFNFIATKLGQKRKSNQFWTEIGGKRFYARSKWEHNYACFLEFCKNKGLIIEWHHEPREWWFESIKRGVRSYKPDFEITLLNGEFELHEVKGYLDSKSKTKLARMAKYYPNVKIRLVDSEWFKLNNKRYRSIIPNWK